MSIPTSWQPLPVDVDADVVMSRVLLALAANIPGWVPREGALELALAEEVSIEVASLNQAAVDSAEAAIAGIGVTVHGLPAITGTPATIPVTITTNAPNITVDAGFLVSGTSATGATALFTLPAPVTTTALMAPTGMGVADATLVATAVGDYANDVPAGPLTVITATATVVTVVAKNASTGGIDPETRTEYLTRLIAYLSTLRPGAVRATDVAVLARSTAGVQRALAIDLYDAQTNTDNVPRTVSVYPVDDDGAPPSIAVQNTLRAALEALREVNFVFRIATPTYTPLTVAFTAQARPGANTAAVKTAVIAALRTALSPAAWGATSPVDPTDWTAKPKVRQLELVQAVAAADITGLAFLTSLTINGSTADATLTGRAGLPAPTTATSWAPNPTSIDGTVTA